MIPTIEVRSQTTPNHVGNEAYPGWIAPPTPPGPGLYDELIDRFLAGEIIPFLGAGASAFAAAQEGGAPPGANGLSDQLARRAGISINFDSCGHRRMDLAKIASYYQHCVAPRRRLDALITTEIGNPGFRPNILHEFLASVA